MRRRLLADLIFLRDRAFNAWQDQHYAGNQSFITSASIVGLKGLETLGKLASIYLNIQTHSARVATLVTGTKPPDPRGAQVALETVKRFVDGTNNFGIKLESIVTTVVRAVERGEVP